MGGEKTYPFVGSITILESTVVDVDLLIPLVGSITMPAKAMMIARIIPILLIFCTANMVTIYYMKSTVYAI